MLLISFEDQFYLYGKLNAYRKRNPVSNVHLYAILYNQKGQSLIGNTRTDSVGRYAFKLPFITDEWKMCIYTTRDGKNPEKEKLKTYYVGIDRQFSPEARYLTPEEREILHPLKPNAFVKKPFEELEEEDEFIPITEKDHVLQNVTVKAKRRYFTNDDWRWKNEAYGRQYATLYYDIDNELEKILDRGEPEPTIFEFLAKNNKMFICSELPKDSTTGKMAYGGHPIKWIVDNGDGNVVLHTRIHTTALKAILGTPLDLIENAHHEPLAGASSMKGSRFTWNFPMWMSEITNLYIVPDSPKETNMAVRVYLYTHRKYSTESNKGLRRTYFQGFNQASTFKTEDYSVIPPMADFRRTIWWQPDVTTDAQGKAKVEFFNNSTCEEMYISVEGMTPDGKVLVNEKKIQYNMSIDYEKNF